MLCCRHPDNREKFNRYESSKNVTLREDQIGITEYVRPGPGFTGIIKHRISDFQVSEIDLDGNVAKLTDIKAPVPPKGKLNSVCWWAMNVWKWNAYMYICIVLRR